MRRPRGLLPTLSLAGLAFAAWSVLSVRTVEPAPPPAQPPRAPYEHTLAGTGVIEPAAARVTALSAPFSALVTEVSAEPGREVEAGTPLFRLDDRSLVAAKATLEADLEVAKAEVVVLERQTDARDAQVLSAQAARDAASARVLRLQSAPRPEEIPPLEARVEEARATTSDWADQVARLEVVRRRDTGTVSDEDLDRKRMALRAARAAEARVVADLALAKAGTWAPDLAEARATLAQAEGLVGQAKAARDQAGAEVLRAKATVARAQAALAANAVEHERAIVRAPADATVLDVLVRAGEYATANRDALVVLGDLSTLLVRVDVDEESAPLVRAGAKAQAVVRGFPTRPFPLTFVRIEPYVKPKRSLSGATNERVDTRVLQLIFRAGESSLPLYVGQQVDVFMDGSKR